MKERPILFSAPMVRAILAGTKTQTRRVVKPQPSPNFLGDPIIAVNRLETGSWAAFDDGGIADNGYQWRCPYGQPGDRLWVREAWYCDHYLVQSGPYKEVEGAKELTVYAADGLTPYEAEQPKWKPSIHMPRWASRITLAITGVRVERLQDISEEDAKAEGIHVDHLKCASGREGLVPVYSRLWESINRTGSWAANPWVWVVEFRRITP